MSKFHVSVERFIPAPAQQLFDIVADPSQHPLIDGSGTVKSFDAGQSEKLALGKTFSVGMKFGKDYTMVNTVIEYEEGRRFFMGLLGFPRRNRNGIEQTLERLHQVALSTSS